MQVLVIMIKTKTFLKQKKKSFHCDSAPLQPFSSSSSPLSPLLPEDILVSQTSVVRFWSLLILILSPARLLWVFITRRQSETRSSQTEDKDTSYISSPHFTEVSCSSEQTLVGFWLEVNLILHLDWYCSLFLSVFNSFLVPVYIYFSANFYKWNQIFYISLSVFNNDLCCKCSVLHGPVVVFDWVMLVSQGPELFSQTLAQCVCVCCCFHQEERCSLWLPPSLSFFFLRQAQRSRWDVSSRVKINLLLLLFCVILLWPNNQNSSLALVLQEPPSSPTQNRQL